MPRCALMHPLGKLLAYIAVTGSVLLGLAGGGMWLVRPDPQLKEQARAAPAIPARIADSIERKKEPVRPAEPEIAKPVMKEASVALTPAPQPKFTIREMNAPPQKARPRRLARDGRPVQEAPPVPTAAVVSTARTDFPY